MSSKVTDETLKISNCPCALGTPVLVKLLVTNLLKVIVCAEPSGVDIHVGYDVTYYGT